MGTSIENTSLKTKLRELGRGHSAWLRTRSRGLIGAGFNVCRKVI
jgi:hypothetical protein